MDEMRLASQADAEEVLALYRSLCGKNGCTWNEYYPAMEEIDGDIVHGDLFVLSDETGIYGAISATQDEDLDELNVWSPSCLPAGAFMRVAVREDRQGRGIARKLVRFALEELRRRGYYGVHFMVSPNNPSALRCYARFGFRLAGQTQMFGEEWLCYEGELNRLLEET